MVRHQCRYCSHLVTGDGIWCHARQRCYSEASTKRRNSCRSFEFNPVDAYLERDWEPDRPKAVRTGQMRLEFE